MDIHLSKELFFPPKDNHVKQIPEFFHIGRIAGMDKPPTWPCVGITLIQHQKVYSYTIAYIFNNFQTWLIPEQLKEEKDCVKDRPPSVFDMPWEKKLKKKKNWETMYTSTNLYNKRSICLPWSIETPKRKCPQYQNKKWSRSQSMITSSPVNSWYTCSHSLCICTYSRNSLCEEANVK